MNSMKLKLSAIAVLMAIASSANAASAAGHDGGLILSKTLSETSNDVVITPLKTEPIAAVGDDHFPGKNSGLKFTKTLSDADEELNLSAETPDPLESFNRPMFKINYNLDHAIFSPVAKAYEVVTPSLVRRGVGNFFSNMGDAVTVVNDVLQGNPKQAIHDAGRVVFNTTFGLLGLFDWASMNGMTKHSEDFGQTLAVWGVGSGPYIVIPFIGPMTIRDSGGKIVDSLAFSPKMNADGALEPIYNAGDVTQRNRALLLDGINTRANYLKAGEIADEMSIDPYIFQREAYIIWREKAIKE